MSWIAIGHVADIPRRGARCVSSPLGRIAVFRTMEDEIHAVEDRCPHRGGPLSQGIVHGAFVTCPLHSSVIALDTGEMQGPDEGRVRTYPLRVDRQSGAIELFIEAAAVAEAAE